MPPACTVSRVVVEVVEDEASEAIEAKETERSGGKPPSVSIWRLVKDFLRAGIKKKKEVREGGSRKITKIFVTFFQLRKLGICSYVFSSAALMS